MPDDGPFGQNVPNDSTDPFNAEDRHIRRVLADLRTAMPVLVTAVYGPGYKKLKLNEVIPNGFVDVHPLVNMQDGRGNTQPHGVITGIPFARAWSGYGGLIHDPVVGDKGTLVVCDRDISSVKANLGEANPGSRSMHDLENGVYVPNWLDKKPPMNYIQMRSTGINVTVNGMQMYITIRNNRIFIEVPEVWIDGNLYVTGLVRAGVGTPDQVDLQLHTHPGTAPPVPVDRPPPVPPHPEE